jgi:hypothetical protein
MRHYLGMFPVPAGAALVVVGYWWGDVLAVYVDRVLIHPSEGALYCNNAVLGELLGHRVEQ